jgi:hypothetical protein
MLLMLTSAVYAATYEHEIKIQKMIFSWKVDGRNLDIKLAAHTKGWVGVGFNPSVQMKDARFVLGYVKDGQPVISNQFGDYYTHHEPVEALGEKSGVKLISGTEEGGVTTMEFTIPLASPGPNGKNINPSGMNTVLLAYGPDFDSFMFKHRFRVRLNVNLMTGNYSE